MSYLYWLVYGTSIESEVQDAELEEADEKQKQYRNEVLKEIKNLKIDKKPKKKSYKNAVKIVL